MNAELAVRLETKVTTEGKLLSRLKLYNQELRDVKALLEAELGKPNEETIEDIYPPGSLRVKAVSADGGPHKWRVFLEWEPNT